MHGIPELQSPPIEPFFVDKIAISDVDNAKLYLRDATITGLCDFTINSLHIDLDKLHFDIGVIFKKVFLNGTYDFDVHVLVPFVQKGPVFLTTENLLASVGVDMKIVNKNNKRYVYMSKLNLILDIKTLSSKFDMNGEEKSQLNEILSTFLGSNEEEFINRVKPTLGKEISKQVLSIANNIVKHFTFDELFPERPIQKLINFCSCAYNSTCCSRTSYIHICGRRDPEIEQCILNNINNLKIKICKGIPELDIPSNDPFIIKKLVLAETPEIKLYIINAQIRGFCEFNITHFRADIDTLHYDVELIFDQIRAKTTYDFDIRLLVPIVHKGPLYITTDNIGAKVSLDFKIVTRNGKRYTYLAKMKLNLDIKKYNAEYNVEGDQFGQLQKIIHNFIASYIHVCGRRDPNLDQCIFNNVENLKDKICEGMPDLNIPSNNPLILDELVIFDSPDNKLYIKDTKMTGLCDFVVNYLHLDIDKLHFDVDLLFKQIQINGTYNLNVRLLVPITNTAQVYITTDNVGAKVSADMKMVTKGNQRYMFFSKMTINLDIKGYNIDFSHERELGQLREIIRNFVGDNQQEIIRVIKPALEESITKRILLVANNIPQRLAKLDQCIISNIDNLKGNLCKVIPKLSVPPGNPYTFDELLVSDAPNTKMYIRDAKIMGIFHFDIELLYKRTQVNTTYDFNIRLLVPISYKRLVYITIDNIEAKIDVDMKLAAKGSKTYAYISKLKINIDPKNYNVEFDLNKKQELG
ncbi:hypothetical protein DBV15_08100 [Temnothorax longispinosus]|uniref:Uncharacterized protein n=1 Tax=Temnothorax longispinosus TaxID=300112 RepID=A0A4V3SAX5_9HYME|nr:hypothetical protein DBV15_08100 [Temnothorax longispinosus]